MGTTPYRCFEYANIEYKFDCIGHLKIYQSLWYNARLVVAGYLQTPGVNCTESYAPVAGYDWEIMQMEV